MIGECFSCARTPTCIETSLERILTDYTCLLYRGVPEPVYLARLRVRYQFGDKLSAEAILNRQELEGGEIEDAVTAPAV